MNQYEVKVSAAPSFDAFLASHPEARQAMSSGVAILEAPAFSQAPVIHFDRIRKTVAATSAPAPRRPGSLG